MTPLRRLGRGLVAGAVGTTALNTATHLDMVVRGRPASRTPQQSAERLSELLHLPLPAEPNRREAVLTGLGAVLGTGAGVAAGIVTELVLPDSPRRSSEASLGVAFGVAMLAGNGPMVGLGITDPRSWSRTDWLADLVPHAAYAIAAGAVLSRR